MFRFAAFRIAVSQELHGEGLQVNAPPPERVAARERMQVPRDPHRVERRRIGHHHRSARALRSIPERKEVELIHHRLRLSRGRSRARFQASGCPFHQAMVRSSVVASGSVSRFAENFPTRCPQAL